MYRQCISVLILICSQIGAFQDDIGKSRGPRVRHGAQSLNTTAGSRRLCDTTHLDHRLQKLEKQTIEKSEMLHSEIKEANRRLQALEWQTADVHTTVQDFKSTLERFSQNNEREARSYDRSADMNLKIDNLAKELQLIIVAIKTLKTDVTDLKTNLSNIAESTNFRDIKHSYFSQRDSQLTRHNSKTLPRNCKEVQEEGNKVSGIYRIQPEFSPKAFMVLCDLENKGGGWTYIQNRYNGKQNFYLNWHSYKLGFGNLVGEFWLGLENIHQLTSYEVNELVVEMEDFEGRRVYAFYGAFSVGSEAEGYPLKVLGDYRGTIGDSLIYHAGSKFSTKDVDQDDWPEGSCAQSHTGAWWYHSCDQSNLNGKYLKGEVPENYAYQGMYWKDFRGEQYSLFKVKMMVRPQGNYIHS